MKRYESRMESDLQLIRERVKWVSDAVLDAVRISVNGLRINDRDVLHDVVLDDLPINREVRSIDARCHAFVARHLPAAGPLRFISSVLRINIALERIGDYAVTIGRIGARLSEHPDAAFCSDLVELTELATGMLRQATEAFLDGGEELAQDTRRISGQVDLVHNRIFTRLTEGTPDGRFRDRVSELTILHQIERVSDQAKNICDEALFVITGRPKAPKVYRVLFLDEDNSLYSQLAAALASKAYSDAGRYFSAGIQPADALSPVLLALGEQLALDLSVVRPHALEPLRPYPAEYHVIVTIGEVSSLPELPFQTPLQRWALPEGDTPEASARMLAGQVRELMELLRGSETD
ncbi:MAG: phosphate transport system protein [Myxococcota bacterium]|jgi:phosphate transport system protein